MRNSFTTMRLQLTGKYEHRKHNIFVILFVNTVILVMPTAVMIAPIDSSPTKDLFSPNLCHVHLQVCTLFSL